MPSSSVQVTTALQGFACNLTNIVAVTAEVVSLPASLPEQQAVPLLSPRQLASSHSGVSKVSNGEMVYVCMHGLVW